MIKIICALIIMAAAQSAWGQEMRKYSVQEIDELRHLVENQYLWGSYSGPSQFSNGGMSRSYSETEKAKVVEEQVRTWMLAGKTAKDLMGPRQ